MKPPPIITTEPPPAKRSFRVEAVRQRAQLVDAGFRPPRGRPGRRPGRDHEVVVGQQVAIGQQDLPGSGSSARAATPRRSSMPSAAAACAVSRAARSGAHAPVSTCLDSGGRS